MAPVISTHLIQALLTSKVHIQYRCGDWVCTVLYLIPLCCLVHAIHIEQHDVVTLRRIKLGSHFQHLVPLRGRATMRGSEEKVQSVWNKKEGVRWIDKYHHLEQLNGYTSQKCGVLWKQQTTFFSKHQLTLSFGVNMTDSTDNMDTIDRVSSLQEYMGRRK